MIQFRSSHKSEGLNCMIQLKNVTKSYPARAGRK